MENKKFDQTSFDELCNAVWNNFVKSMNDYFANSVKRERYFNEFWTEKNSGKNGALVLYKDPWYDVYGDPTPDYDWVDLDKIQSTCGNYYDSFLLSNTTDKAYVILTLVMTGDQDVVPDEFSVPNMKIKSCLGTITKSPSGYLIQFSPMSNLFTTTIDKTFLPYELED